MPRGFNISIFGSPPFQMFVGQLVKDDDFLEDAKRVLAIEADRFEQLARTLEDIDSFVDRETLSETVEKVLGATDDSRQITRTIWRLASMLRDSDEPLEQTVSVLKTAISEGMKELSPDEHQAIGERLDRLAARPSGFDKQHKAEQLAEATGKELEAVQIICDLRPVFSSDRSEIEGVVPVTVLRLDVLDRETRSSVELRLTEQQLLDLCEKVEKARKKVAVLNAFADEKGIRVPRTALSKQGD